jgi:hypothetical protein
MHLNTLTVVNSRSCVVIDYLLDVNRSWLGLEMGRAKPALGRAGPGYWAG